jgi:hypothetical protein
MHEADWDELEHKFSGSPQRVELLAGLREALLGLRAAGCRTAYIDGSFVTAKEEPGDFDGCWEIPGVDGRLLDPVLLELDHPRVAQKEKFRGEMFPTFPPSDPRVSPLLDFFQHDREGNPKGIIKIDLEALA